MPFGKNAGKQTDRQTDKQILSEHGIGGTRLGSPLRLGWLLCRRSQHTTVRALPFSGTIFEFETKTTIGATKTIPIGSNPSLVHPRHFLGSSQGFTSSKTKLNSGLCGVDRGGGVRRLAAFWWFAKGDLFFDKPFVDVFSILGDDYYRAGMPCKKNPRNI